MDEKHEIIKKFFKIIGPIILLIGVGAFIASGVIMPSKIGDFGSFWIIILLGFLGVFLIGIGSFFCIFGYAKGITKYQLNEYAPVLKDVHNDYINPMISETVKTIKNANKDCDDIICTKCDSKNKKGSNFCNNCGQSLIKLCPACGKEIEDDSKFCSNCGSKI